MSGLAAGLDIRDSSVRYFCYDRNNRQEETPRRRRAVHPALGRHGGRVGRQPLRQPDPRPAVSRRGADDRGGHRRDARHGAVQRLQLHQGIAGLEPDPPGADPRRPPRSFRGGDRHLGSGGADRRPPQGARDRPRGRCAARLRLRCRRRSDHQPGREQAAEGNAGFHRTGRPLVHADAERAAAEAGRADQAWREDRQLPAGRENPNRGRRQRGRAGACDGVHQTTKASRNARLEHHPARRPPLPRSVARRGVGPSAAGDLAALLQALCRWRDRRLCRRGRGGEFQPRRLVAGAACAR